MDLVAFLGACLDEDERVARAVVAECLGADVGWYWGDPGGVVKSALMVRGPAHWPRPGVLLPAAGEEPSVAVAEHIARWDPARVLAEVAAKREILRRFESAAEWTGILRAEGSASEYYSHYAGSLREVLLVLAQPYAGRPGWRPEWATEVET